MLAVLALMAGLLVVPGVGDTVDLRGQSPGELVAVTLTRVVDPARGSDEYDQPAAGNRFVATQFRITNAGTVDFDDSPDNDVQVIDSRGQTYTPALATVAAGPGFPGAVHIAPGDARLGYVVFEVPAGASVTRVQFIPDSGFAPDIGEWRLTARPTPAAAPADVVRAYVTAINDGDYQRAWTLGGRNFSTTYESFVAGFAITAHDDLTVESTSGDVVTVRLDAAQTDGSHRVYAGSYTVRDGVIVAAHLTRVR